MEVKRKAMRAAHEWSAHGGREGKLSKVAQWYQWPDKYVNIKD
jgi:hypothetical protein